MTEPIHALRCKSCQELVEIPPIPPVEKIVKEPCKCGLTEGARTSRHIMLGVICSISAIALAIVGGISVYNWTSFDGLKTELEVKKVELEKLQAEFKREKSEATKYKELIDRLFIDRLPPEVKEQLKKKE